MSSDVPIKVKNPRDLFSVVPYALGYQPEESIVVICVRQAGSLGMIARTSLSDLPNSKCCIEIGEMIAQNAAKDDTVQAFVVIYCRANDEFTLHGYKKQARHFADALQPIPSETWVIGAERYFHVDRQYCKNCPAEGFPVAELENTEASAALVFRGYAPAKSRDAYVRLPQPADSQCHAAQAAETKFGQEKATAVGVPSWRQKALTAWQKMLKQSAQNKSISPKLLGLIGAALTDTAMRDAILISCLPGGIAAAKTVVDNPTADQQAAQVLAAVVGDENPKPPDLVQHRAATTTLEAVAAHVSTPSKTAPLTLLAFLAWWAGDGTRAATRVGEALAIDPDYRLAVTLAGAIGSHLQPGWIKSRTHCDVAAA